MSEQSNDEDVLLWTYTCGCEPPREIYAESPDLRDTCTMCGDPFQLTAHGPRYESRIIEDLESRPDRPDWA